MAKCRETAGFLFAHACDNSASRECRECKKPICDQHTRTTDNGSPFCLACYKKIGNQGGVWQDDPLLYSSFLYHDYDDLSQFDRYSLEDRQSFAESGAAAQWTEDLSDGDWENDLDGS